MYLGYLSGEEIQIWSSLILFAYTDFSLKMSVCVFVCAHVFGFSRRFSLMSQRFPNY